MMTMMTGICFSMLYLVMKSNISAVYFCYFYSSTFQQSFLKTFYSILLKLYFNFILKYCTILALDFVNVIRQTCISVDMTTVLPLCWPRFTLLRWL